MPRSTLSKSQGKKKLLSRHPPVEKKTSPGRSTYMSDILQEGSSWYFSKNRDWAYTGFWDGIRPPPAACWSSSCLRRKTGGRKKEGLIIWGPQIQVLCESNSYDGPPWLVKRREREERVWMIVDPHSEEKVCAYAVNWAKVLLPAGVEQISKLFGLRNGDFYCTSFLLSLEAKDCVLIVAQQALDFSTCSPATESSLSAAPLWFLSRSWTFSIFIKSLPA